MGKFYDKFLGIMKLNDDDYDDYDDDFEDEEDDEEFEEKPAPTRRKTVIKKETKKERSFLSDFDDDDEEDDELPIRRTTRTTRTTRTATPARPAATSEASMASAASQRQSTRQQTTSQPSSTRNTRDRKVVPMRSSRSGMEVCVIKPTTVEDSREITDTLLSGRAVVLNLEGLQVDIAQRIIDFTSGSCYSINGNLQKITNYIFIITPETVDISGDFQEMLGAGLGTGMHPGF